MHTKTIPTYSVLQILLMGVWDDYSSLKTDSDIQQGIRMVDREPDKYRIISENKQTVLYTG